MDEEEQTIVIDTGGYTTKCGFGGDDAPHSIFPTVVGHPRFQGQGSTVKDAYVGDEAIAKQGVLAMKRPIEFGVTTSFDDIEKIYHHAFYDQLRVQPEEQCLLISDTPNNPKVNRERITQILFETFNVPSLYLANNCTLDLFACGKESGMVIDSGLHRTIPLPVYQGHALNNVVGRRRKLRNIFQ